MMAPQKKRVRVFLTLQNQTKYLRDLQKQAKKKEKTIALSQLCQTHFHHRLTLLWPQAASIARTQHTARTQDLTRSSGLLYFFHYPCLPTFSVSVWSPSSGHLYTQTCCCPLTRLRGHPCLFPQQIISALKGGTTILMVTFYIQSLLPVQGQSWCPSIICQKNTECCAQHHFP